jgi:hypothetical protein
MSDRFRPCEIIELADTISLLNEEHTPDISPRHARPLAAVLAENLRSVEALLDCLEHGVSARTEAQRDAISRLYLASRRQLEAIAVALELMD